MEKKMEDEMETGIIGFIGCIIGLYCFYIRIMEKKMETLGPFKGICRIMGLGFGVYGLGFQA